MESYKYKGFTVQIMQDGDCKSPLDMCDQMFEIICFHPRYNLGTEHDYNDIREVQLRAKEPENNWELIPLYLYDHSGLSISLTPFSCNWDSGQVGFVIFDKDKAKEEYQDDKDWEDKAWAYIKATIEAYDNFLQGNCFYWRLPEIGESCGGYIDDPDMAYVKSEAEAVVDAHIESELSKQKKAMRVKVETTIRILVPEDKSATVTDEIINLVKPELIKVAEGLDSSNIISIEIDNQTPYEKGEEFPDAELSICTEGCSN